MRIIIAERLRRERLLKNKTQADVAEMLNIQRATYGFYENGKVLPPVDKLIAIAEYFGVTVDYLLGNDNEPIIDVVETLEKIVALLRHYPTHVNATGRIIDTKMNRFLACSLESTVENINILMGEE